VAAVAAGRRLFAAKYDLVIKGGRVIDPGARQVAMRDVGIGGGRIIAVEANLTAADAASTIDATGKLVVPGLIDIHTHVRSKEMPSICVSNGVTSLLDAGSQGVDRIDEVIDAAKGAPNRVRILLNVARTGILPDGELMDISRVDVAAAQKVIAAHRDLIVGVKARLSRSVAGKNDMEALRRAQAITAPLKLPVMIHMGDTVSPLPDLLALLKPGDIVTHLYAPGVRRHIQRALKAGATREEITAVLQLCCMQGLHSMCVAAPILIDELGQLQPKITSKRIRT
jgi:dihydroorotase